MDSADQREAGRAQNRSGAGRLDHALRCQVVLVTPAAQPTALPEDLLQTRARVLVHPTDQDVLERVRNALVPIDQASADYRFETAEDPELIQRRNALLAGSSVVLVLAAASMLIVSIEQVRERRQQLAAWPHPAFQAGYWPRRCLRPFWCYRTHPAGLRSATRPESLRTE
jgi:hypothetical protein